MTHRNSLLLSAFVYASFALEPHAETLPASPLAGLLPSGWTSGASVDESGNRIAVVTTAANALAQDSTGAQHAQILVRDRNAGVWIPVTMTHDRSAFANGNSWSPQISADGRFVVFTSEASDLAPLDQNGMIDVFLRDLETGSTSLVSRGLSGEAAQGMSQNPTLSRDGEVVAFYSNARDLVSEPPHISEREPIFAYRWERRFGDLRLLKPNPSLDSQNGLENFTGSIYLSIDGGQAIYTRGDNLIRPTALHPFMVLNHANLPKRYSDSDYYVIEERDGRKWDTDFSQLATPPIWFEGGRKVFLSTISLEFSIEELENLYFEVPVEDNPDFSENRWEDFGPHAGISETGEIIARIIGGRASAYMRNRTTGDVRRISAATDVNICELMVDPSGRYILFSAQDSTRADDLRRIQIYSVVSNSVTPMSDLSGDPILLEDNHFGIEFFQSGEQVGFVFETDTALSIIDQNGLTDVYTYDLTSGAIELVSLVAEDLDCGFLGNLAIGSFENPIAPADVAWAPNQSIIVANNSASRIRVLDALGQEMIAWGEPGAEVGQLSSPTSVFVNSDGAILVADTGNHRIQVFSESGEFIRSIGAFGTAPGMLDSPGGIATDRDGTLLVADTGNHRIQAFDSRGNPIRTFGSHGNADGFLDSPEGVAVSAEGDIVVADTGNDRIQVFNSNGDFIRGFGSSGSAQGGLNRPSDLIALPTGEIAVADTGNHRIQIFDDSGNVMRALGSFGAGDGEFQNPNGLAVSAQGELYVADTGNDRISTWTRCLCDSGSGDVDCNGRIDIRDALAVRNHAIGHWILPPVALDIADVNGDGALNEDDLNLILEIALEM